MITGAKLSLRLTAEEAREILAEHIRGRYHIHKALNKCIAEWNPDYCTTIGADDVVVDLHFIEEPAEDAKPHG